MLNMIAELPSRNTLLIADACFSGSVFKTRNISTFDHQNIKDLNNKISRVAITSGNDTEVPDESVFMKYLIKALESNKEKYMTSQKLFVNNIDKFICIYNDGRSIKFIKNKINNIFNKLITINHLQKLYADILNIIVDKTVKIVKNKYKIKNNTNYNFDFFLL